MPYVRVQRMSDAVSPWGSRCYWKSGYTADLSEEAIGTMLRHVEQLPSTLTQVHIWSHHGAVNRVPVTATAFPHRGPAFNVHIMAMWREPGQDNAVMEWVHGLWDDVEGELGHTSYLNFMGSGEKDKARVAYGPNYERLSQLKEHYDPGNMFRSHLNERRKAE